MARVIYWAGKKRILPGVRAAIGDFNSGEGTGSGSGGSNPPEPTNTFVIDDTAHYRFTGVWMKDGIWRFEAKTNFVISDTGLYSFSGIWSSEGIWRYL